MVNKMKNNKIFVLKLVFALLLLFSVVPLSLAFNKNVKADYIDPVEITPYNVGFDKMNYWWTNNLYKTSYENYGGFVNYGTGNGTGYIVFYLGSDNPDINTIFINANMWYADFTLDNFESTYLLSGLYILECGFTTSIPIYNDKPSINTNLDMVYLPYKLTYSRSGIISTTTQFTGFIDVSDLDIYAEGKTCFVIRIKQDLYQTWSPGLTSTRNAVMPHAMFTDIELNSGDYFDGYTNGTNDGYNQGLTKGNEVGYANGYSDGYNQGLLESSADYGISDLLFTIYDTPFSVLYNLFSFTIFGVSFWTIISSLIAILVVLWVVKRFFF